MSVGCVHTRVYNMHVWCTWAHMQVHMAMWAWRAEEGTAIFCLATLSQSSIEPWASSFKVLGLQGHMVTLGFLCGIWGSKLRSSCLWNTHSYCAIFPVHILKAVHYAYILNRAQQVWDEDFGLSSLVVCCRRNGPGLIFPLNRNCNVEKPSSSWTDPWDRGESLIHLISDFLEICPHWIITCLVGWECLPGVPTW